MIIDDFLANGCALEGLIDLVQSAGATVEGIGIAIGEGLPAGRKADQGTEGSVWNHLRS